MRNFDNVTCEKCSVFLAYTQIPFFNETSTMSTGINLLDKVNYLGKQSAVKRRCLLGCGNRRGMGLEGGMVASHPLPGFRKQREQVCFQKMRN